MYTCAAEIEHVKLVIAKLRRMEFSPKSDKFDHLIDLQAKPRQRAKLPLRTARHAASRRASRCLNTSRAITKYLVAQ